jgi:hypothetical protein
MSKKLVLLVLAAIAAPFAAGCNNDHGNGTDDAGIQLPDSARTPDAFANDAYSESTIGTPCTADTDCHGMMPMCINDPNLAAFFPGGYCSQACDPTMPTSCPTGSSCQMLQRGMNICLLNCDQNATTRQCSRMGYGCSTDPQLSGVCMAGCFDSTDCPANLMCDRMGGQVGAGACYTPGATVGIACVDDTQCPMGGACLVEDGDGWPGGSCVLPGCDAMANNCPGTGSTCIPLTGVFGPPQGYCLESCVHTSDCRVGYTCTASTVFPDRHYCTAGCTTNGQCSGGRVCNIGLGTCDVPFTGTIGAMCQRFDPTTCPGGSCISERSGGYPNAMCTYAGCSATEPCPGNAVCSPRPFPSTTSVCYASCSSDTQCRTGYHCRPSDPSNAGSARACVPSCTMNSDCVNTGDTCNLGTGLCAAAFTAANLGMACTSDSTCAGGHCMTEAASGYPGGMCVFPGCALSGTGGAACPASSTCIDDHYGDPTIGVCAPTCTSSTSCRAGFSCAAVGTTTTMACQPMCTTASCATGRTCNTTTGLCS